jgi:hypothetical protein
MKLLTSLLVVILSATISHSQAEVTAKDSIALEVVKFSWSKQRIGWERDPFGGPLENFDEMRSRARNEKRLDDAKRGGGGAGADKVRREASADAAIIAKQREKGPARYVFVYKLKVKNHGPTAIAMLDWDHIFFESGTDNEVGRQQFTSEEPIGPGKTKELAVTITSPPTHTVSVTSLNKNDEQERLSEKVVLVRVKLSDGRIWQNPSTF